MLIEIDLAKLERGLRTGRVKVTRGGKTFWRKQRVGAKEIEKPTKQISGIPPNSELMAGIKEQAEINERNKHEFGFSDVSGGDFTYTRKSYGDFVFPSVKFKLEGNDIINIDSGMRVTIPEKYIEETTTTFRRGEMGPIAKLDSIAAGGGSIVWHNEVNKEKTEEINNVIRSYNTFSPKLKEIEGETGKYAPEMHLKYCINQPKNGINDYVGFVYNWYAGDEREASYVGKAAATIVNEEYDENNIYHSVIDKTMSVSKLINSKYGNDFIYRGETNPEIAEQIVRNLMSDKEVQLADKMFSCTENERLGKWYASVHSQINPQGRKTKTNVMLKIPRKKFEDNVILDYRVCGSNYIPEEEVTIVGNNINLSPEEVMIYTIKPGKKSKSWISVSEFMKLGGNVQQFISEMKR